MSNDSQQPEPAATNSRQANKTQPTDESVADFINRVDTTEARKKDAHTLLEIMGKLTSEPAVMWGPSIIGFGEYHYKYASGREGDAAAVGFSPRKSSLVLYGLNYAPAAEPLLAKLGKFKSSVACLYISKLTDVELDVLKELITLGYNYTTSLDAEDFQSGR